MRGTRQWSTRRGLALVMSGVLLASSGCRRMETTGAYRIAVVTKALDLSLIHI